MGYQISSIQSPLPIIPLNVELSTPKISVTDFMGEKRYSFLKKSGFLMIYDERRRLDEIKKIKDEKNILSYSNLHHIDIIRESTINWPHQQKSTSTIPIINSATKASRKTKSHKIEEIEYILNKCDKLNKKNPNIASIEKEVKRNSILKGNISEKVLKRSIDRKISRKELNLISLNANRIE